MRWSLDRAWPLPRLAPELRARPFPVCTALHVIAPIYATLYAAPWYGALGAKLGRLVELSTANSTSPGLLEISDGGTIANEVSLGAPRVEGRWMTVAPTRIGRRAFVGNGGVVPAGTTLGDGSLLGVRSLAPACRVPCRILLRVLLRLGRLGRLLGRIRPRD